LVNEPKYGRPDIEYPVIGQNGRSITELVRLSALDCMYCFAKENVCCTKSVQVNSFASKIKRGAVILYFNTIKRTMSPFAKQPSGEKKLRKNLFENTLRK
jgi:hypothetical protein